MKDGSGQGRAARGGSVTFKYELKSCPMGYELRTTEEQDNNEALQECHKCDKSSEYIIRPNEDVCQPCPKGLNCNDYIRHKLLTLGQARSGGGLAERVERGGDSVEFRLAKRPLGGTYRLGNLALASRTDDGRGDLWAS